jgi:hypothetical protein
MKSVIAVRLCLIALTAVFACSEDALSDADRLAPHAREDR